MRGGIFVVYLREGDKGTEGNKKVGEIFIANLHPSSDQRIQVALDLVSTKKHQILLTFYIHHLLYRQFSSVPSALHAFFHMHTVRQAAGR